MTTAETGPGNETPDLPFPEYIACHLCGVERRVIKREAYVMSEGTAGVAWAKCRKCRHTFVRFIGEERAAARLAERWLGLYRH
jgi:hypothetical protein